MDAEDEQRMRLQLLSNELRKAMVLVNKFKTRYVAGSDECSNEAIAIGIKTEAGNVPATLASFLQDSINQATQEMQKALQLSLGIDFKC